MTDDEIIELLKSWGPYWAFGAKMFEDRRYLLDPDTRERAYEILKISFERIVQKTVNKLTAFLDEFGEPRDGATSEGTARNIQDNVNRYHSLLKTYPEPWQPETDEGLREIATLLGYGEILYAIEYRMGLEKRN